MHLDGSLTEALDLGENRVGCLRPLERFAFQFETIADGIHPCGDLYDGIVAKWARSCLS